MKGQERHRICMTLLEKAQVILSTVSYWLGLLSWSEGTHKGRHTREQGTGNHLGSRPTESKLIMNCAGPNNLHQFIPAFGYPCGFQVYDLTFFPLSISKMDISHRSLADCKYCLQLADV